MTVRKLMSIGGAAGVVVVVSYACARGPERARSPTTQIAVPTPEKKAPSVPTARGGGPSTSAISSAEAAIDGIAEAACAREERCFEIGVAGAFESHERCLAYYGRRAIDDIGLDACPGGLNRTAIEACVQMIREQDCSAKETPPVCRAPFVCAER